MLIRKREDQNTGVLKNIYSLKAKWITNTLLTPSESVITITFLETIFCFLMWIDFKQSLKQLFWFGCYFLAILQNLQSTTQIIKNIYFGFFQICHEL